MRFVFLSIFSFIALSCPAMADDFEVDSSVSKAVIYPSRAEVTRTAQVEVPAGNHTIIFNDLQRRLFTETLRISGAGNQTVVLGALSHKVLNSTKLSDQRANEINTNIQTLKDKNLLLEADKSALESKKAFYNSLNEKATEQTKEQLSELQLNSDQWVGAADVLATEYANINKAIVQIDLQIRETNKQITKLMGDLGQLRQNSNKQTYQITVPVEAMAPTMVQLELSYQLPSVQWTPVYDARLNSQTGELNITQYGSVKQTTGEDWNDVEVVLSTAQPQQGAGLPDLPVWRVRSYEERKSSLGGNTFNEYSSDGSVRPQYQQSLEAVHSKRLESGAAPIKAAVQPTATINTGGVDVTYDIPGVNTILSDGTESKLLIGPFEASGKMEAHVKPQIAAAAYLANRTTLNGEAVLLPGTVNLFRDSDFIGTSRFPLLRPGNEHVLYFGIDSRIAVERDTLEDTSDKARMLWDENVKTHTYITTVENLRQTPVSLVVMESVPVSAQKGIDVEILEDETTAGYEDDVDNKKGHLAWRKELAAGEETEVKLGWKVSWPKGENINGL